jgi:hypothetical protein
VLVDVRIATRDNFVHMPRRYVDEDEDWEGAEDDAEGPDASDVGDEDDEDDTIPCPHCGKSVYEQAQRCPHCGQYFSDEAVASRKPLWVFITALVLAGLLLFLAFRV